jgi:hypothetical protein
MTLIPPLDAAARADLHAAIRTADADDRRWYSDLLAGHVTPDDCGRCDGTGCHACRNCTCPRCDPYTPDYVRESVQKWRPTHA